MLKFPQLSVALQVLVIVYYWAQEGKACVTSVYVMTGTAVQLSVLVAVPVVAGSVLAVQDIVTFGGQVTAGRVVSDMFMV